MNPMRAQIIDGKVIHSDNTIRLGTMIHGGGTVTKEHTGAPAKSMCAGCYDNHYNQPGNSANGECWAFKTAKVCNKVGYSSIHVANGPDTKMVRTLTCWHAVSK